MKFMYETEKIGLIPFSRKVAEDYGAYFQWWYDPDVTKYNSHGLFPQSEKDFNRFFDTISEGKIVLAIIEKESGEFKHIGNVSLQSINHIYQSAEFAIIIGDTEYWGKGIGTDAGALLLRHGFEKLNLNRIWTGTAAINYGMQSVALKLGMQTEAIFREGMFLNGHFCDIWAYSILKRDYYKNIAGPQ